MNAMKSHGIQTSIHYPVVWSLDYYQKRIGEDKCHTPHSQGCRGKRGYATTPSRDERSGCPMYQQGDHSVFQGKGKDMNVLGIGAHYDDLELGCSGTLIKHARNGDRVTMLVVTDSEYMNPSGDMVRSAEIAIAEGTKAAGIICADLVCFELQDVYGSLR